MIAAGEKASQDLFVLLLFYHWGLRDTLSRVTITEKVISNHCSSNDQPAMVL